MSDTFCVLPWYGKEISRNTKPCCLLPVDHDIEDIKKTLLSGQQHPACQKCWDVESSGQTSRRQQENKFLDYKLDRDLEKIQQDCIDKKSTTLLYQVNTSNLCNQACVTCNSSFSTKWQELDRQMNIVQVSPPPIDDFSKKIDYANAKRIEILGGEPLFDPVSLQLLDQLLINNNRDCFISVVTNGSITLKPTQIDKLKQLNDLNICVSIDGIESVFEYMRWPGKWAKLLENIEQYRSIAKTITVSYTISAVNALYYDQTTEWFNNNNLSYNHNIAVGPAWVSLNNMPVSLKHILSQKNNFVSNFCKINGNETPMSIFSKNLIAQDQAKKINIQDYMPELASIIADG
jgi:hypothetical protein